MKKPFKTAAWCGIVSLVLSVIIFLAGFTWGDKGRLVGNFFGLISGVLWIFFTYGFVVLGKRFKNTLLTVMAWIGVVIGIIILTIGFFVTMFSLLGNVSAQTEGNLEEFDFSTFQGNVNINSSGSLTEQEILGLMIILILWIVISLIIGAYRILFGVGLLKLKDRVQYANTAGILEIVGGATLIVFVGFIPMIAALIVEIIMLFKASEKFEGRRKI
ncbi:hypothetical protein HYV50_02105 [Candidatus Pacearchaeota archaeon]|nr:hypothetical protein [Candidatus Pacearchaeota archaeon]